MKPPACRSFGTLCRPDHPLGAPMAASEGLCRTYYRFQKTWATQNREPRPAGYSDAGRAGDVNKREPLPSPPAEKPQLRWPYRQHSHVLSVDAHDSDPITNKLFESHSRSGVRIQHEREAISVG